MIPTPKQARWLGVGICVAWGLVSGLVLVRATAQTEYALAANEARSLASSFDSTWNSRRTPVRTLEAAGRIVPVVRTMQRKIGRAADRIALEDRAIILPGGWQRLVSVPIKDADQWEIVGAVVLRARWWNGSAWGWGVIGFCVLVASLLVRRGMRRASADAGTSPLWLVTDTIAVFALGMTALALLARIHIANAATVLPAATQSTRFDPLVLALPDPGLVATEFAVVLLVAAAAIVLLAWVVSPRLPVGERREALTAWGFLAPSALHLALFTLGPLVFTAWLSLHDWDLLSTARPFVGLANYVTLGRDPLFWNALGNTAVYSLYVPVTMALALGAALVLNQPLRGVRVLRAIVFLPAVISYVAIAMVWQWLYHADYGLLNYVIRSLGGTGVDWLGNPGTALLAVMIVSAWVQVGYQMIVYLAGLQGIPAGLHEAARLDGASSWNRFRYVTLPLLRPVSLYLFITGIIWSFQVFALVYVMTEGGPVHATDVLVYQIYQNAWEFRRMGYASAMSWVLFAILVGLTAVQWRLLNKRVDHAA
ncbi:MAG: sugar ABC transporter permease [Cytophagaceae bacterium]|nr:sugar ABC transporter permease [Gemmatimonadaceae bacterium]